MGLFNDFLNFDLFWNRDHTHLGNNSECVKGYSVKISVPLPCPRAFPYHWRPPLFQVQGHLHTVCVCHCVCVSLFVHVPVCVYKSFQRGFKYVYTHTPVCTCRVFLLLHKQRLGPRPVPHLALFTSRCILAISPHQHIESVLLLLISAWHHGGEFLRTLRTSGAGRMLLCRQTLSVNEWVNE